MFCFVFLYVSSYCFNSSCAKFWFSSSSSSSMLICMYELQLDWIKLHNHQYNILAHHYEKVEDMCPTF